jgi:hypothetical protein
MLEADNIDWQTQRFRRMVQLSVRRASLDRAKPIVARHAIDVWDNPKCRLEFVHRRAQRVATWVALPATFFLFIATPLTAAYVFAGGTLAGNQWPVLLYATAFVNLFASILCGWLVGYGLGFVTSHNVRRKSQR